MDTISHRITLVVLGLFLFVGIIPSCRPEGGGVYQGIYILQGDILVDAHNYVFKVPHEGGVFSMSMVNDATPIFKLKKGFDEFTVLVEDTEEKYDSTVFSKDQPDRWNYRYVQKVSIQAPKNSSRTIKKAKYLIYVPKWDGLYADFFIEQEAGNGE